MDYIELFILSMLPVIELRAAIPIGFSKGLNPIGIYVSCVLGATVVSVPIILTCRYILDYMKVKKILTILINKIDKKIDSAVKKIGDVSFLGLILFVGIPLPTSGSWTASMIASILKLRLKKTVLSIFIGNMLAGMIILLLSSALARL